MAHFYINVFINARDKSCKVGRAPYGVHLISNNADRAPSGHWPMLSYTDGDRRPNDMKGSTQVNILKYPPVPGRLSIRR